MSNYETFRKTARYLDVLNKYVPCAWNQGKSPDREARALILIIEQTERNPRENKKHTIWQHCICLKTREICQDLEFDHHVVILQLTTLQSNNTENLKQIFTGKQLLGYSPNSYIHVSVSELYIPLIGLPILLQNNRWAERKNI